MVPLRPTLFYSGPMFDRSLSSSSTRQLVALSVAPGPNGDRVPIAAIIPRHLGNVDAVAALVEVAALETGATFKDFLKLVAAAAPPEGEFRMRAPQHEDEERGRKIGRPARDWREDYGKSAHWLGLSAVTHFALAPALGWAGGLREALRGARAGFSHQKYDQDARALRQAVRGGRSNGLGWRRNCHADQHFPADLWKMFAPY